MFLTLLHLRIDLNFETESTFLIEESSLFHSRIVEGIKESIVRGNLQNGTIMSSPFLRE